MSATTNIFGIRNAKAHTASHATSSAELRRSGAVGTGVESSRSGKIEKKSCENEAVPADSKRLHIGASRRAVARMRGDGWAVGR